MTDVVLKSCRGRRAVGGGRSRKDRLELIVLKAGSKCGHLVVRSGTALSQGYCDLVVNLEKRQNK